MTKKTKHSIITRKSKTGKFGLVVLSGSKVILTSTQEYEKQSTCNKIRDNFLKSVWLCEVRMES